MRELADATLRLCGVEPEAWYMAKLQEKEEAVEVRTLHRLFK